MRFPSFSLGMMRIIGMNNVELCRNNAGTAATAENYAFPRFFLPFLAELKILKIFLKTYFIALVDS